MNCPTCGNEMADHSADTNSIPGVNTPTPGVYFCAACALWHHLTPTNWPVTDNEVRYTRTRIGASR